MGLISTMTRQQTNNDLESAEQAKDGPLHGFRVLDLSSVVSGPMAAVVLADQGADVIKIEPPGWGDGIRGLGASRNGLSAIYSMINRNKRSVAINLKHPEGQALIRRLAADADVLLQNYRPGKMARLGLDYEALRGDCPNLIYASINGMGEVGPYAEQKTYDYVIQALSGILDVQGATPMSMNPAQADDAPRQIGPDLQMVRSIIYDKVTALTAAQGITAALLARERNGHGQHVQLSMLDTAIYFNWPELMWNYAFKGQGVQYAGDLADVCGISETADGAVVSGYLGADCRKYATDELMELLAYNEIPAGRVNTRAQVLDDPQVQATQILQDFDHPRGGAMRQPRNPLRFSNAPKAKMQPSADLGEHTVEVLADLGLSLDEMQKLAQQGVIG
jgi:crotonobetainyl-CoA:carnitine CoA-transferase CaiB-like acyl-CoA transferase